jgi:hypothetical protein
MRPDEALALARLKTPAGWHVVSVKHERFALGWGAGV